MEFLKEILGEELFSQVESKINEHNGNEANKDNQIKVANLAKGDYVSKGKFTDKETELTSKIAELTEANNLIAELKKSSKGDEELQGKITGYENQVATLQKELADTKIKSAIKLSLLAEKAVDVDYLTYKLKEKLNEKGESLELDENENIKGWDDKLSGLKTQFPTMFEASAGKQIIEKKLPEGDSGKEAQPTSLAEALRMQYESNE